MADRTSPGALARLKSVAYTEFEEEPDRAWKLEPFELEQINLIVGLNATGKSRVLRVLYGLARSIDGTRQPTTLDTGHYRAVFDVPGSGDQLTYEFSIAAKKVKLERLSVGQKVWLDRVDTGKSLLWFEKNQLSIEVHVPTSHLAISARRDENQHPYFEPLHAWAKTVKYCEFSKLESQTFSAFEGAIDSESVQSIPLQDSLHLLIKASKDRYAHAFTSGVLNDMRRLGYQLESFGLKPAVGVNLPLIARGAAQTIFVRERNVGADIPQNAISNGMLRALAALIFLHASKLNKTRDCLLLDDIGEGLDFDRSTKLIKIFTEEADRGYLQLVMTTNDRFVMNSVPVSCWSIIQREGGKVEVFNAKNSPESFDEFEKWGFNNFDFFAKRFYVKEKSATKE